MFHVGDFSTPFRRHAVFPVSVNGHSCVLRQVYRVFSPCTGEPPRRFFPCVVIFRFFAASRVPAWAFFAPALAFFVSRAGRAGLLLRCRAGSAPTWTFVVSRAGRAGLLLRCRAGSAPAWTFVVSRAGRAGFLLRCRAGSAPTWTFVVSRAGRAGFLLRCRAGFFAPAWAFSALRRGRIPIGKQARPRSAGKREAYRKRRERICDLPPLLYGNFGHTRRVAPAALRARTIRDGKTACRPTLPVSRG